MNYTPVGSPFITPSPTAMNHIRLQTIQISSTYIPYMSPQPSLFSLESDSFRDDKGLCNGFYAAFASYFLLISIVLCSIAVIASVRR